MDEYIERSGVLFLLEGTSCLNCKGNCKKCKIDKAIKILEEEPAADVAPVVHGRWDDSFDGITPVCSVCGRTHKCFNRTPNYCPNCGAKMCEED